ncbi:MAG TPA: histidinol-phosphate transaminase [Halobacteria archaeon]|nr:histidinol-phosphate transaminase [Halobacteria archaeon]
MQIRKSIDKISDYVPGKNVDDLSPSVSIARDKIVKLSSNENPYPPSTKVIDAIVNYANKVNYYPDPHSKRLYGAISAYLNIPVDNIYVNAGVDGVLDTLMKVFIDCNDKVMIPIPTFTYYELTAIAHGAIPVSVTMDENFFISAEDILDNVDDRTKIIFLCSPNNPTGNIYPEKELFKVLDGFNGAVILDEAYAEFANQNYTGLINEYDNIIVLRTLSKAFGIAGMRVGYAILPEKIKKACLKVSTPFAVSYLSIEAAYAALNDLEYINYTIQKIKEGRDYLQENIPFKTYPSYANFVLVDVSPFKSSFILDELAKRGFIVRDCSSFRGMGDKFIRVSVGREEDNVRLVDAFNNILKIF